MKEFFISKIRLRVSKKLILNMVDTHITSNELISWSAPK